MGAMQGPRPVALVTGAARRIGRAIATCLARAGHDVAIHYRTSSEAATALARELSQEGVRAEAVCADLADRDDVRRLAEDVEGAFGRVDVLVNNASVFHATPLLGTDPDTLLAAAERFYAVHVLAPLALARALAPGMVARGSGRIVSIADVALSAPRAHHAPYLASKAALVTLMRSLARELAPHVAVNVVSPGVILPPDGDEHVVDEAALLARVPAGRFGTPEEVAEAVLFFAQGPAFVTGQVLAVAGGEG